MLSEEFKTFIQSAIDEEARQEQERRAQQEAATRAYEDDVKWFIEVVLPALRSAVESVQALLPEKHLFTLAVFHKPKEPTAALRFVRLGRRDYTREVTVGITSSHVTVSPGRSSGVPWPDKLARSSNVARTAFSAAWVVRLVESFVEHSLKNPG